MSGIRVLVPVKRVVDYLVRNIGTTNISRLHAVIVASTVQITSILLA